MRLIISIQSDVIRKKTCDVGQTIRKSNHGEAIFY